MSKIKGTNTRPERIVRSFLFKKGFRFRLHSKELPGRPDIVIKKYNSALFVDGCYWHRHEGCKYSYTPKSNTDFWNKKFRDNIKRDNHVNNELEEKGWKVIRLWECEIKNGSFEKYITKLIVSD